MTEKEKVLIELIKNCEVAHYVEALDNVTNLKIQLLLKDALIALKDK